MQLCLSIMHFIMNIDYAYLLFIMELTTYVFTIGIDNFGIHDCNLAILIENFYVRYCNWQFLCNFCIHYGTDGFSVQYCNWQLYYALLQVATLVCTMIVIYSIKIKNFDSLLQSTTHLWTTAVVDLCMHYNNWQQCI